MKTELRKQAKNDLEKDFFKYMNNAVSRKTTESVRNDKDIKLITTKKKNQLVSETNYLTIEMKKMKVKMNKPVYLVLSILYISKTLMYEILV